MNDKFLQVTLIIFQACFFVNTAIATELNSDIQTCVMKQFSSGNENLTLAEVRLLCSQETMKSIEVIEVQERKLPAAPLVLGAISNRIISERKTEFDPYVLTPHKMNYILPALTTSAIHKNAYQNLSGFEENLTDLEAKFQLSIKAPLNTGSLFVEGDGLYVGFTLQAWWQIYAEGISKPFRETNYQPELFYITPLDWHPFGGNTGLIFGIEHQSNGRGQDLSRSWNRVYGHFLYEKKNLAISFRPWIRLSEDEKTSEFDPDGDDNPDIADYMGHFELGVVYEWNSVELSAKGRRNFSTDKGYAEIGLTFPLWVNLKAMLQLLMAMVKA